MRLAQVSVVLNSVRWANLITIGLFFTSTALAYFGTKSSEYRLTFEGQVVFHADHRPDIKFARVKIAQQLRYIAGPMSSTHESLEGGKEIGPKKYYQLSDVHIQPLSKGWYSSTYLYEGIVVGEHSIPQSYQVTLPLQPDNIYAASLSSKRLSDNDCTDEHYSSSTDFPYFWNPKRAGCGLREGVDFRKFKSNFEALPRAADIFPKYEQLAVNDDHVIPISVFFSLSGQRLRRYDKTSESFLDLFRHTHTYDDAVESTLDASRQDVAWFRQMLIEAGFQRSRFQEMPADKSYIAENFTKRNAKAVIIVNMFFGVTGINEPHNSGFHHYWRSALEQSAVIIYNGHSGMGGHLDLGAIERQEGFQVHFDPKAYQIIFLNACRTYSYYGDDYRHRKSRIQDRTSAPNLDLITNGMDSSFGDAPYQSLQLINAIDMWASDKARPSYQEVLGKLEAGGLTGVTAAGE